MTNIDRTKQGFIRNAEKGVAGGVATLNEQGLVESSSTFIHHQSIPATQWEISHGLNKYPTVTTVDSAGQVVVGDVFYLDTGNVKIIFASGFSGKSYLN